METWMKADIFFFVTTACVAIVSIAIVVLIIRIVTLVGALKRLVKMFSESVDSVSEEARDLLDRIKANPFFNMLFPAAHRSRSTKRKKK